MEKFFGFVLACFAVFCISSCGTTYFVDPVSTPVFTAPGQGDVQVNLDTHDKFFLEGAYALPDNYALVLTRENFSHGLDNDQSMMSFAFGHFWPNRDGTSAFQVLAGFGTGSQRIGPDAYFKPNLGSFARAPLASSSVSTSPDTTSSNIWAQLLMGNSDFRKYFIQAQWASRGEGGTLGMALRLYYLDQYNFYLASKGIVGTYNSDTSITVDRTAKNGTSLDIAAFGSIALSFVGASFIELYALMQVSMPPAGHYFPNGERTSFAKPSDPVNWDGGVLSAGVKVKF